eukprot:Platyproteum_vivax@DN5411_c0_g1_i1.p1
MEDIKMELLKHQSGVFAEPEVVKHEIIESESEDDENERELRRLKAKERALKLRKEEEEELKARAEEEGESESDQEQEEESASSEGEDAGGYLKPVFVVKSARRTVVEREQQELEEEAIELERAQRAKEKKSESSKILVDVIRREEEEALKEDEDDVSDVEMPDDGDNENEEEQYELWKIRELKRIKRDKEEREARANLLAEIERRRNMTDIERIEDNKRLDALRPKPEKTHRFGFMQKYYHKGAFFQDKAVDGTEPIYLRDFQAPVGEDLLDKSILPEAMKKRRGDFGRAGQVKHTHLTDVDTTDFNAAWAQDERATMRVRAIGSRLETFDRPGTAAAPKKK